jgi:hypothetical protein
MKPYLYEEKSLWRRNLSNPQEEDFDHQLYETLNCEANWDTSDGDSDCVELT